jgi:hypothetical protein
MAPWHHPLTGGPDAARYLAAAQGVPVSRPFHLRWALPYACGTSPKAWWLTWLISWPILAVAAFGWAHTVTGDWRVALAAAALLLSLPGILGPRAVIPIGVDLPATATTMVGVWLVALGHPAQIAAGVIVIGLAATIRETSPVWAALWAWSPWPLIALVAVAVAAVIRKPGPDPLGPTFQTIADHPIRSSLEHHRGQWRDAWVMVAPWGVTLAALVGADWRFVAVLAVAYAQLLIATDTTRLLHHGAGPVMALAAAQVIPTPWLLLAVAVHVAWWRPPHRV